MQAEADRLRAALPRGSIVIALDEHGQDLTTPELAQLVSKIEQTAEHLVFLIGGPDGLDQNLKAASQYCLRISSMTLPHGLARILLVEQIYRMRSLKMNHPYHRSEVN
jgi:23S rRNA (pseudouridine1915-N3)-methyltransferase